MDYNNHSFVPNKRAIEPNARIHGHTAAVLVPTAGGDPTQQVFEGQKSLTQKMQLLAACLAGLASPPSADFAPVPPDTRKRKPLSLLRSLSVSIWSYGNMLYIGKSGHFTLKWPNFP